MELLDQFDEVLLISFGAALGANTRFKLYQKLEKINFRHSYIILVINTFSSFSLGLILSTLSYFSSLSYYHNLGLFFTIGVFGSLSTFSTFIYDLFELFVQLKFYKALSLFFISMTSGILFLVFGFLLGKL